MGSACPELLQPAGSVCTGLAAQAGPPPWWVGVAVARERLLSPLQAFPIMQAIGDQIIAPYITGSGHLGLLSSSGIAGKFGHITVFDTPLLHCNLVVIEVRAAGR